MMDISGAPVPPAAASIQPRRSLRWTLVGGLILLVIGVAAGGWAMQYWLQQQRAAAPQAAVATSGTANGGRVVDVASGPTPPVDSAQAAAAPLDLTTRVAALEARLAAISFDADNQHGNAVRAEGLLIAFAVRRALDRGLALGTLESQLRLRFGDAQPNAVKTVIAAATVPVTLEKLQSEFDRLAPALAGQTGEAAGFWSAARRELGSLFILRSADAPATRVAARLEQARRMLDAGLVDRATIAVAALPGAASAKDWLADAQRYHDARRALDLIETAAILAPREADDPAAPPAVAARP